jgi:hypothetical protein
MPGAVVTVAGAVTAALGGEISFGGTILNAVSIADVALVTLLSGVNTIGIPTGAVGCYFVPYASNAQQLTLKGAGGDTGLILAPTQPVLLSFGGGINTFIIQAAGNTGGVSELYFF